MAGLFLSPGFCMILVVFIKVCYSSCCDTDSTAVKRCRRSLVAAESVVLSSEIYTTCLTLTWARQASVTFRHSDLDRLPPGRRRSLHVVRPTGSSGKPTRRWSGGGIPRICSCACRGLVVTSRRRHTQSWPGYQQVCQRYIKTCLSKLPISYQQDTVNARSNNYSEL